MIPGMTTAPRIEKRWPINHGRDAIAMSAGALDITSLSFGERSETDGVVFTTCGCFIDAYVVNWAWPLTANQWQRPPDPAATRGETGLCGLGWRNDV